MLMLEEFFHWVSTKGRFTNSILPGQWEFALMVLWIFQFLSISHEVLWRFLGCCVGNQLSEYKFGVCRSRAISRSCFLKYLWCFGSMMCCHESLLLRTGDDFGISSWVPLGWKVLEDIFEKVKSLFSVLQVYFNEKKIVCKGKPLFKLICMFLILQWLFQLW